MRESQTTIEMARKLDRIRSRLCGTSTANCSRGWLHQAHGGSATQSLFCLLRAVGTEGTAIVAPSSPDGVFAQCEIVVTTFATVFAVRALRIRTYIIRANREARKLYCVAIDPQTAAESP